ncbi:MAG: rhodanese-like domain-containing protein [Parasphingopyxis sp.]|uniref:rhodanese-like domain-containing protein n=1 Tax=Parasphingopyxis sp. TaxID=1920299 RepID=UPI0032EB1785
MTVQTLSPQRAHLLADAGEAEIFDIREPDEFARSHIAGSRSLPLSDARREGIAGTAGKAVIFTCRSGARTAAQCGGLAEHLEGEAYMIEGGIEAWRKAGLPIAIDRKAPLELMRQVQIAAGSLVLAGVLLGWLVAPAFFALAAFVGAGLTFAGATGFCGMARLLAAMPWNRRAAA